MEVLGTLAARRLWVYGGGLVVIVGLRTVPVARPLRVGVTGLVLATMVLTCAGERAERGGHPSPVLLIAGFCGVAAGSGLVLSGRLYGLVFLVGGLLFLRRTFRGGEQ